MIEDPNSTNIMGFSRLCNTKTIQSFSSSIVLFSGGLKRVVRKGLMRESMDSIMGQGGSNVVWPTKDVGQWMED